MRMRRGTWRLAAAVMAVVTLTACGSGAVPSLKEQEQAEKVSDIRGEVKEIGFGNQIRSYVMQPYTMVKDHRTNVESGNVGAVLDGELDTFINGYLKWINS